MVFRRFSFILGLAFLGAGPALGQSFDCSKAATATERLICADRKLGALDVDLAAQVKKALAADPARREALLAEERRWVKERDRSCAAPAGAATDAAKTLACLTRAYEERIAALKGATEDGRMAICRRLGERYRTAFESAAADERSAAANAPLDYLSKWPDSGLVFAETSEFDGAPALFGWTKAQRLKLSLNEVKAFSELSLPAMGGGIRLEHMPGADYFVASRVLGSAFCYSQVYFWTDHGRVFSGRGPEGWDEGDAGCFVRRWLGRFEGTPAAFEEPIGMWRSLTAKVTVAPWVKDRFAPECRLSLAFSAQFDAREPCSPSEISKDVCEGADCDDLRRATLRLLDERMNGGERRRTALASTQNEIFSRLKDISERTAERRFLHGAEEFAPLLHDGEVYIARSMAALDPRGDELLDRIVTLARLHEGRLEPRAIFVIPVSRGRLLNVSME